MKICSFFLIFLLAVVRGYAQDRNKPVVVNLNGYMIDFSGQMIFQPCDDSITTLFDALDGTSFNIWCNQITEQYCDPLDGLGDTVWVKYKEPKDSVIRYGYLRYIYCSIKIVLRLIGNNPNDFIVYDRPAYEIIVDSTKYPLKGFAVSGILKEVIPTDSKLLYRMYEFYQKNRYVVPQWLYRATVDRGLIEGKAEDAGAKK